MSKKEDKKKKKNDAEIKEEAVNTATSTDEAKDADAAKTAKADDDGTQKADDATKESEDNSKTDSKASKKDAKDVKIEELQDKVKRQMAEFDNFRKRTEKEKASMYEIGAREIIEKILPVVDNFERGLAAVPEEEKDSPFADGMTKIYKQMMTVFEEMGVKAIDAVGEEFNPDYHNAVMHVEDEEAGENVVVEEFQKGYLYKDHVVRHSMVKVAN